MQIVLWRGGAFLTAIMSLLLQLKDNIMRPSVTDPNFSEVWESKGNVILFRRNLLLIIKLVYNLKGKLSLVTTDINDRKMDFLE